MPTFTHSEPADLNVFTTIVRRRSFRHLAQELGVSTSTLSHSMHNLEARLGVELLNRTSCSMVPTDASSTLAVKLEDGLQVIGEVLGELDAYRTSPVGRLRLNVSHNASRLLLGPVLRRFTEVYPNLQLELSVEDRMVGIVADSYDAGIRYGGTVPQDMVVVLSTGELRWMVAASPDYLARYGVPQRPNGLLRHACIRMRLGDSSFYKWELGDSERMVEVDVPDPFSVNESDTAVAAALDGVGLAYCLEVGITEELRSGRLQLILPDWTPMGVSFCLYYPSQRQPQPGLHQLMEMIRGDWLGRARVDLPPHLARSPHAHRS